MTQKDQETDVLERGDVFFLYRPKVEEEWPGGPDDVQHVHVVLRPDGRKERSRLLVLGRKGLPRVEDGGGMEWGFVERVSTLGQVHERLEEERYRTKTRGGRTLPAERPAGEGRYALVRHGDHTHLAYKLELPRKPGEVQKELHIPDEGSFVLSVKNPEAPSPPNAGLPPHRKATFPRELEERFRGRRWVPADPPRFLDHEGAEVLLVGARRDAEKELGIRLDTERETLRSAEIFRDLLRDRDEHPVEPLTEGEWA
jgi:hypothetical protein